MVLLLAAAAAGCGSSAGLLDFAALQAQATAVHGLAGEGSVMARATADGELTGPYRRVHAAELADASLSASDALAAPTTNDRLTLVARRLRGEAIAVTAAFRVLAQPSVTPAEVRAAQAAFARAAAITGRLGDT